MLETKIDLKKLERYEPELENRKGKIRMDFNENFDLCSNRVKHIFRKIDLNNISIYPEYHKIKDKIAQKHKINRNNILLTAGSNEAIKVILETYLKENDKILIPTPSYIAFEVYAKQLSANIINIPFLKDMNFPKEDVLKNIDENIKIVVIINPANPTGKSISRDDIEGIIKKAKNSIVILDEAYNEYLERSDIDLIHKYENLIVLQTFSKAYGLAGLRIGYAVSNKNIISKLKYFVNPYSISSIATISAIEAIKDKKFIKRHVKNNRENKDYLIEKLRELNIKTYDSDTNFILADFKDKVDLVEFNLFKNNILVRNLSKIHKILKGHIRISISHKSNIDKLISIIKKTL